MSLVFQKDLNFSLQKMNMKIKIREMRNLQKSHLPYFLYILIV